MYNFDVSIPSTWKKVFASESEDVVVFGPADDPKIGLTVSTHADSKASEQRIRESEWFHGATPKPYQSPNGKEGLYVEADSPEGPSLCVGYFGVGAWTQYAEVRAPKAVFDSNKPLFQAILASFTPRPRVGK